MTKTMKARLSVLGIAAALMLVCIIVAVSVTGAYFSETKQGEINGSIGSIHIHTSGGNGANGLKFNFSHLLPGEPQTATVEYQNTGANPQDVWVVFNNAEALHALNNLGTYGEVTLSNSGGTVFHSANLNDNKPPASGTCGPFSESGCWPLQKQYLVSSNVQPGAGSYFKFTFAYASKFSDSSQEGDAWNLYPPESATPEGNGLPYQVVATQVGQEP
ncbi:MAG TPA: hypothetical protein VFH99_02360 [Candidatus Saccharimonadales bacterium]|nr:hypothetical protein [Candidatus Saccharimonadales bacterium]